jgi:DNA-binding NarL/FixJ family response regulator
MTSAINSNVFNSKGEISMNRKGVIIATKEPHIHDWVLDCVSERDRQCYGLISAPNKQFFDAYISKPEMVMAFIETDFFGDGTIGMLEYLKKHRPKLRIIVFSVYDIPPEAVSRYLCWGADSYLCLRDKPEQVQEQIKMVFEGSRFMAAGMRRHIDRYNGLVDKPPHLTHKEIEILLLFSAVA